jgi:hypothetical protein
MMKLANGLTFTSLGLAALGTFSMAAGHFNSRWGVLGSSADSVLMVAMIMVLLAIFLLFSRTPATERSLAPNVRLFFGSARLCWSLYQAV